MDGFHMMGHLASEEERGPRNFLDELKTSEGLTIAVENVVMLAVDKTWKPNRLPTGSAVQPVEDSPLPVVLQTTRQALTTQIAVAVRSSADVCGVQPHLIDISHRPCKEVYEALSCIRPFNICGDAKSLSVLVKSLADAFAAIDFKSASYTGGPLSLTSQRVPGEGEDLVANTQVLSLAEVLLPMIYVEEAWLLMGHPASVEANRTYAERMHFMWVRPYGTQIEAMMRMCLRTEENVLACGQSWLTPEAKYGIKRIGCLIQSQIFLDTLERFYDILLLRFLTEDPLVYIRLALVLNENATATALEYCAQHWQDAFNVEHCVADLLETVYVLFLARVFSHFMPFQVLKAVLCVQLWTSIENSEVVAPREVDLEAKESAHLASVSPATRAVFILLRQLMKIDLDLTQLTLTQACASQSSGSKRTGVLITDDPDLPELMPDMMALLLLLCRKQLVIKVRSKTKSILASEGFRHVLRKEHAAVLTGSTVDHQQTVDITGISEDDRLNSLELDNLICTENFDQGAIIAETLTDPTTFFMRNMCRELAFAQPGDGVVAKKPNDSGSLIDQEVWKRHMADRVALPGKYFGHDPEYLLSSHAYYDNAGEKKTLLGLRPTMDVLRAQAESHERKEMDAGHHAAYIGGAFEARRTNRAGRSQLPAFITGDPKKLEMLPWRGKTVKAAEILVRTSSWLSLREHKYEGDTFLKPWHVMRVFDTPSPLREEFGGDKMYDLWKASGHHPCKNSTAKGEGPSDVLAKLRHISVPAYVWRIMGFDENSVTRWRTFELKSDDGEEWAAAGYWVPHWDPGECLHRAGAKPLMIVQVAKHGIQRRLKSGAHASGMEGLGLKRTEWEPCDLWSLPRDKDGKRTSDGLYDYQVDVNVTRSIAVFRVGWIFVPPGLTYFLGAMGAKSHPVTMDIIKTYRTFHSRFYNPENSKDYEDFEECASEGGQSAPVLASGMTTGAKNERRNFERGDKSSRLVRGRDCV